MAYKDVKTEHAFQTFHKDLKNGEFPPIIFMYGEEGYLIRWAVGELANLFVDSSSRSVDYLIADEIENVAELTQACDTFSIFSEKRVIWAKDFPPLIKKNARGFGEGELERLRKYIADPNPGTILVFSCERPDDGAPLVRELKKTCKKYDFSKLDRPQLTGFAEKRFRAAGVPVSRQVLKYFIDETGYFNRETDYRLFNLVNDIEKLAAYCAGGEVTEEAIDQTLKGDLDKFAFDFLDALTAGRKGEAFSLLYNILGAGEDFYSVLGLITSQFELMLEALQLSGGTGDSAAVASKIRANAYRVKKALSFAEKMGEKKLKAVLSYLYETDRNVKNGQMDGTLALELLIGRM